MISGRKKQGPVLTRIMTSEALRTLPIKIGRRQLDAVAPLVLAMLVWEAAAWLGVLNANALPPPSLLIVTAYDLGRSGTLFANCLASFVRVVSGLSIAILLGISVGVLLGTFQAGRRRITPLFDLLRPIPPIAWIPIAILWFGLGNGSAVFIVVIGAFFPIVTSTYSGICSVSQGYVNAARSLGASSRLIMTDILLPAALPQILTGIRIGVGIAWTSVIAAEMVGAHSGLGYAIQVNRTMLEIEAVIVNMVVIGLIGALMNRAVERLERRLMRWADTSVATSQAGREA